MEGSFLTINTWPGGLCSASRMWWPPSISVLLSTCMKALEAAPTPASTTACVAVFLHLALSTSVSN